MAQGVSVVDRDPETENRVRGMRSMQDIGRAVVLKSEVSLLIHTHTHKSEVPLLIHTHTHTSLRVALHESRHGSRGGASDGLLFRPETEA